MERAFDCPICGGRDWRGVHSLTYRRGERDREGEPLTEYELLRRRVLFEIWFPEEETVTLTTRLCRRCGFLTYSPRPSDGEVAAKYRFLAEAEGVIGGMDTSPEGGLLDRQRAERTREAIVRQLGREPRRVLDFGGGDGKLLAPFAERGVDCSLIDYNPRPLPGVRKLADTLEEAAPHDPFDAIVCSHVLEHVAKPAAMLRSLAGELTSGGVLFSEVPLEVWRGIPIERDPVTHINFFTLGNFVELHARAGLTVARAARLRGSYGQWKKQVAIVLARSNGRPSARAGMGAVETERLLEPRLRDKLVRAWRERRLPSRTWLSGRLRRRRLQQSNPRL